MTLSEELIWRGFCAETTIKDPKLLDTRENRKFYWGADPSADSLTIGNLAALMMCACFIRHGYEPYLLVGGATGQIGDPKENGERELKPLAEVEHNKRCIRGQIERILKNAGIFSAGESSEKSINSGTENATKLTFVDNLDWFGEVKFLDFLREVGKVFSMTQLLDRQFVQNRIGERGAGISYAEFSYTLIQGYDFLHLFRKHGVALELCGADQYGNCASGIHLIRRLEGAEADVWSTPLVIDPVSGRKFGKSEGNAVWLASRRAEESSGAESENFTSVFDFYQFWLNQPDTAVEYLLKIYTLYEKEEIERILAEHGEAPERRVAQKALAKGATEVVHGREKAESAIFVTEQLFKKEGPEYTEENIARLGAVLGQEEIVEGETIVESLSRVGLVSSKAEARRFLKSGAISFNNEKITDEKFVIERPGVIKRGKNKFAVVG